MLVSEMTALQLYCLIMAAFLVIYLAALAVKEIGSEDLLIGPRIMYYLGLFVMVVGPALYAAVTILGQVQ